METRDLAIAGAGFRVCDCLACVIWGIEFVGCFIVGGFTEGFASASIVPIFLAATMTIIVFGGLGMMLGALGVVALGYALGSFFERMPQSVQTAPRRHTLAARRGLDTRRLSSGCF
jgi:hypothetical protein